ncbi:MAG: ArsR/SmtB family transcription factor [Myxococcales bacterium]|jgi:DNA-binding transcriptional ArsR family regulator
MPGTLARRKHAPSLKPIEPEKAEQAAEILKAVAHPLRLQIIALLCEEPLHVKRLAELLEAKQAIVSQQLRILRMRRLVAATRRGGHALYRIEEPHLRELVACIERCKMR